MATGERHLTDAAATARWLGESGELVSRYGAAVGEHVGRMATVNADLRRELADERATVARLRAALATIQQWDCLNPPNTGLCEDFPWLRELVDTALATGTGGAGE